MGRNFARPLNTNDLAFGFLTKVLELGEEEADQATLSVMKAERLLESMVLKSTIESDENRRPLFKLDDQRRILRRKIFDELVSLTRLENDDDIIIENGGARPSTPIQENRQAILITGLPASGKSSIAGQIADLYGAYIVDSDYVKRKMPEYNHEFGASIVHEESSLVTFGSTDLSYAQEYSLYEYCIAKGYNMVIPRICSTTSSLEKIRDALIEKDYNVHLVLVSLEKQESCRRALSRYLETGRYVPLGLVFDGYGNDPTLSYYRVKDCDKWESVGKLSTLELRDKGPAIVHSISDGPVEKLREAGGAT